MLGFLSISISLVLLFGLIFLYGQFQTYDSNSERNYYLFGVALKLIGSIVFCLVYKLYYQGGDALLYFEGAKDLIELFWTEPSLFFELFTEAASNGNKYQLELFGSLNEYYNVNYQWNLTRMLIPFVFLGFGNFYAASCWIGFLVFILSWKIFKSIKQLIPGMDKSFAFAFLFIPSLLFWTSGFLKDTVILAAIYFYISSLASWLRTRKLSFDLILGVPICILILILIKPYVFLVLFPASIFWMLLAYLKGLKDRLFLFLISPFIFILVFLMIVAVVKLGQSHLGEYGKFSNLLEYAEGMREGFDQVSEPHKRIGEADVQSQFSWSFGDLMSRIWDVNLKPYLWDSWNPLSLANAIENFIFLLLSAAAMIRTALHPRLLLQVFRNPFVLFCLVYSLAFSIGLGVSVSNFGALARLKSAYLPFLWVFLLFFLNSDEKTNEFSNERNS